MKRRPSCLRDVYKRQVQGHVQVGDGQVGLVERAVIIAQHIAEALVGFGPVSYTHLDVYKRQPLEYTNEPYAIAKIAGLKMCESFNLQYGTNYIAVMPTNLYGPNDNFQGRSQ